MWPLASGLVAISWSPSDDTSSDLKPPLTVRSGVTVHESDSDSWVVVVLNLNCHCVKNGFDGKS